MNNINRFRWFSPVMCFSIGLIFAVPCLAQNAPPELSIKDRFEKELSVRIKRNRIKGKEIKQMGLVEEIPNVDVDYDGCTYTLEFRNRAEVLFEDLKVECRFFYEEESVWRAGAVSANHDIKHHEKKELKHQDEAFEIRLKPMGRQKLETSPFILQSWLLEPGIYFRDGTADRQDANAIGLWVRVKYTAPNGQEMQRDFYESKSVPSHVTWDGRAI